MTLKLMTEALACTLTAAAIGIVAGLWLCVGSALASSETIAEIATSYWDYHKAHADAVIAQSAQYSVGAPLLVIAFVFQVLAAVASPTTPIPIPTCFSAPLVFLLLVLIPIWGLSFAAYKVLLRVKGARVHIILQNRPKKT